MDEGLWNWIGKGIVVKDGDHRERVWSLRVGEKKPLSPELQVIAQKVEDVVNREIKYEELRNKYVDWAQKYEAVSVCQCLSILKQKNHYPLICAVTIQI